MYKRSEPKSSLCLIIVSTLCFHIVSIIFIVTFNRVHLYSKVVLFHPGHSPPLCSHHGRGTICSGVVSCVV